MKDTVNYVELQRAQKTDQLRETLAKAIVTLRKNAAFDDFFLAGAREKADLGGSVLKDRFIKAADFIDEQWPHRANLKTVDEALDDLTVAEWTITPARRGHATAATPLFLGFWISLVISYLLLFMLPLNDLPAGLSFLLGVFPLLGIAYIPSMAFRWLIQRKFDQSLTAVYAAVDEIAAFALRDAQQAKVASS